MLRKALNVSWKEHRTNAMLYKNLPKVTTKIRQRRMKLAGHCIRHGEELASKLVLWEPTEGKRKRGKPSTTYIDILLEDTDAHNTSELRMVMEDRNQWRELVEHARHPEWGDLS